MSFLDSPRRARLAARTLLAGVLAVASLAPQGVQAGVGSDLKAVISPAELPSGTRWARSVHGVTPVQVPLGANGSFDPGSIDAPGNDPSVIPAGSKNVRSTGSRSDDSARPFRSRGPICRGKLDAQGVRGPDKLLEPDLPARVLRSEGASAIESGAMGAP